jgi:hypothetical protein
MEITAESADVDLEIGQFIGMELFYFTSNVIVPL